jgi:hypothetical protein
MIRLVARITTFRKGNSVIMSLYSILGKTSDDSILTHNDFIDLVATIEKDAVMPKYVAMHPEHYKRMKISNWMTYL